MIDNRCSWPAYTFNSASLRENHGLIEEALSSTLDNPIDLANAALDRLDSGPVEWRTNKVFLICYLCPDILSPP